MECVVTHYSCLLKDYTSSFRGWLPFWEITVVRCKVLSSAEVCG